MDDANVPLPARLDAAARAAAGRPLLWVVVLLALAAWPVIWSLRTPVPSRPPVLGAIPTFELTDEGGRPFGSEELAGRVWVASFIFTRCNAECPAITAKMARIQSRVRNLAPAFHLVSFTADPEYDTPARLAEYAKMFHASPRIWSFLTGSPTAIREIAVNGLKMSLGEERKDDGRFEGVFHDAHLVLIDGKGRVRGYYDSQEDDVVDTVVRDAGLLVNRETLGKRSSRPPGPAPSSP
jgi:protein SCO1